MNKTNRHLKLNPKALIYINPQIYTLSTEEVLLISLKIEEILNKGVDIVYISNKDREYDYLFSNILKALPNDRYMITEQIPSYTVSQELNIRYTLQLHKNKFTNKMIYYLFLLKLNSLIYLRHNNNLHCLRIKNKSDRLNILKYVITSNSTNNININLPAVTTQIN